MTWLCNKQDAAWIFIKELVYEKNLRELLLIKRYEICVPLKFLKRSGFTLIE